MLNVVRSLLTLVTVLIATLSHAQEYHFVSIEKLIGQEVGRIVITEVYKKLGIEITTEPRPANRAQTEVEMGFKDGEIMRIFDYGNENKEVIRVPTPYHSEETTAFVKRNSNFSINSKDDLKDLKVVKVTGVKHTNNITTDMPNVYSINNTEFMMKYLKAGRADVALTGKINGLAAIERFDYDDIVVIKKPLATFNAYHYIHKKHKELVPRVDNMIREMKQSGELEIIIKQATIDVMNRK